MKPLFCKMNRNIHWLYSCYWLQHNMYWRPPSITRCAVCILNTKWELSQLHLRAARPVKEANYTSCMQYSIRLSHQVHNLRYFLSMIMHISFSAIYYLYPISTQIQFTITKYLSLCLKHTNLNVSAIHAFSLPWQHSHYINHTISFSFVKKNL